ncbi:hypothetical protein FE257_000427 [Aspergillus nanangensis]|uniref:GST N-terminal domain-containing protein n=1 Tax=Aspergillus nanangensis TaxID=2582783 RepID=A0AAD4CUT4_ASPNN|nr:hypothetical protein FE257_000427 [Aspergillus nanangensis]
MTDHTTPVHFFDITCTLPGKYYEFHSTLVNPKPNPNPQTGPSKSWSPNTLKTRLILNYKNIPYTQSFISYPDIAPLLSAAAIPPHAHGTTPFTLPAIHHLTITTNPNHILMDSLAIATHLDQTFPARPLFPSNNASYALALAVTELLHKVRDQCAPLVIPNVGDLLDPRGREYFVQTRSARFGKPLSEVRPRDPAVVRSVMDAARAEMRPIADMLRGRPGKKGPFFEGETPGYADFLVVAFLAWPERADRVLFEELVAVDCVLRDLWEACLPWVNGQGEEREWVIPS